jgi:hypothetical protein
MVIPSLLHAGFLRKVTTARGINGARRGFATSVPS